MPEWFLKINEKLAGWKSHIIAGSILLDAVLRMFGAEGIITPEMRQSWDTAGQGATVLDPATQGLLGGAISTLRAGIQKVQNAVEKLNS